ncbi:hypothetical protein PAGU2595_013230 [Lysobacter xanthus]
MSHPEAGPIWRRLWRAVNGQHAAAVACHHGADDDLQQAICHYATSTVPGLSPAMWRRILHSILPTGMGRDDVLDRIARRAFDALCQPRAPRGPAPARPGPMSGAELTLAVDCTGLGGRFDTGSPDDVCTPLQ